MSQDRQRCQPVTAATGGGTGCIAGLGCLWLLMVSFNGIMIFSTEKSDSTRTFFGGMVMLFQFVGLCLVAPWLLSKVTDWLSRGPMAPEVHVTGPMPSPGSTLAVEVDHRNAESHDWQDVRLRVALALKDDKQNRWTKEKSIAIPHVRAGDSFEFRDEFVVPSGIGGESATDAWWAVDVVLEVAGRRRLAATYRLPDAN